VTPASPASINVISIREPIKMGERVTKYHIEINQNGTWATPSDASDNKVQGTVIGNRQLWQMNNVSATGIRLVIESARDVPLIAELSAY
jgi:alpha-L-fucosidase